MPPRPYVLLSCATSADGYLDDASPRRLILSGPADLDRVDEVRAGCDAICVGAQTVSTDNPRLLIRDPRRRARRAARGLPAHPARVTLTASGDLDPAAEFLPPAPSAWCTVPPPRSPRARARLGDPPCSSTPATRCPPGPCCDDLAERAVARSWSKAAPASWGTFLAGATWPMNSSSPSPRSSSPTRARPGSTSPRAPPVRQTP